MCRRMVIKYYSNVLDPPEFDMGNQLELYSIVKTNIANILTNPTNPFHLDGKDENVFLSNHHLVGFPTNCRIFKGKSNNFMHPCIKHLCIRFYYDDGDQSLAKTCKAFQNSIPERAIILATTCVGL